MKLLRHASLWWLGAMVVVVLVTSSASGGTAAVSIAFAQVAPSTITFSGRVLDAAGHGVPGQLILAGASYATTSNADGSYSLQVAPNAYGMSLRGGRPAPGLNLPATYEAYSSELVPLADNTTLDLSLPATQWVTVRVQDPSGNPVTGSSVGGGVSGGPCPSPVAFGAYGGCARSGDTATTNSSGEAVLWLFQTPLDPNARYQFDASPPSGSSLLSGTTRDVTLLPDTPVVVTLRAATARVTGRVLDAAGNGVPEQLILAGASFAATSDAAGGYAFLLPPDSYGMSLRGGRPAPGLSIPAMYEAYSTELVPLADNTTLNLTLPAAKRVAVRVQDPSGNPVTGASVGAGVSGGLCASAVAFGA